MSIRMVDGEMRTVRGTSNSNERGNSYQRRQRKVWLVTTYQADRVLIRMTYTVTGDSSLHEYRLSQPLPENNGWWTYEALPTCRCYRCGVLLTVETVTVDRIIPGCHGGTYARTNIRPACGDCNSETGGALSRKAEHQAKKQGVVRKVRGSR